MIQDGRRNAKTNQGLHSNSDKDAQRYSRYVQFFYIMDFGIFQIEISTLSIILFACKYSRFYLFVSDGGQLSLDQMKKKEKEKKKKERKVIYQIFGRLQHPKMGLIRHICRMLLSLKCEGEH